MPNVDVLPHATGSFHEAVAQHATAIHKLADTMRENNAQMHRVLDEKLHALAADPAKASRPPEREAAVPVLNFAPLDNTLLRLKNPLRPSMKR
ncbi:MAG: hypothetical protein K1X78_27790 [Verrucomicrobiaceae bacterium]|nr:hypothetical protein [Verrucomicrobiaceae bacterium]